MKRGAVILDVDGTLVDSNDAHAHAWIEAFAVEGIAVPFDQVRRSVGMGGDKLMPAVSGIEESSPVGSRISRLRSEIFKARYLPLVQPFSGVGELARRLRDDGFVLVVASSAKKDELDPLLERAGIAELILNRTSSDEAENSKPEPDLVTAAVRKAGTSRDRTLMLGDTPYDIEAATRAGIGIVALECGGWRRDELHGALAVFATPADLLAKYAASPFARLGRRDHVQA